MTGSAALTRTWHAARPINLRAQLGPLRRGSGDPTWGTGADGAIWRTTLTPDGPGLERLSMGTSMHEVHSAAFGPGAAWLIDRLPRLLGDADDPIGFEPPAQLRETAKRFPGWRPGRTERVLEALLAAILEQKITGTEAWRAWRFILREFGEPAPEADGVPPGLRVFPDPAVWRTIPSWKWHEFGVDSKRSATVLRAVSIAPSLEACTGFDATASHVRLRTVSGVGIWTAAETAQRALGDPDAVSYRDYHLAKEIVFSMTGAMNGTDADMAELLLPWAGHRYRVQRLFELSGKNRPRRGPRLTIADHRTI